MKIYLILLFICSALSQDYFNLEINETGESTLFIFKDSITVLEIGDEIAIYDENGKVKKGPFFFKPNLKKILKIK